MTKPLNHSAEYRALIVSQASQDRPHVRADSQCPLCGGIKDKGCLACWPCFRADLKTFNEWAEQTLDMAEEKLATHGPDYVWTFNQGETL